jgi:hypothetical protein
MTELVPELASRPVFGTFDGELVAPDENGAPDFPLICERILNRSASYSPATSPPPWSGRLIRQPPVMWGLDVRIWQEQLQCVDGRSPLMVCTGPPARMGAVNFKPETA